MIIIAPCLSGELTMIQPARSDLVDGGKYTIVVRATDGGKPPLHSDVKVGLKIKLDVLNILRIPGTTESLLLGDGWG